MFTMNKIIHIEMRIPKTRYILDISKKVIQRPDLKTNKTNENCLNGNKMKYFLTQFLGKTNSTEGSTNKN